MRKQSTCKVCELKIAFFGNFDASLWRDYQNNLIQNIGRREQLLLPIFQAAHLFLCESTRYLWMQSMNPPIFGHRRIMWSADLPGHIPRLPVSAHTAPNIPSANARKWLFDQLRIILGALLEFDMRGSSTSASSNFLGYPGHFLPSELLANLCFRQSVLSICFYKQLKAICLNFKFSTFSSSILLTRIHIIR